MNKKIAAGAFFGLVMAGMLFGGEGCGKQEAGTGEGAILPSEPAADLVNGSFEAEHESGEWTGWTRSGSSFNVRGLSDVAEMNGVEMEKDGNLKTVNFDKNIFHIHEILSKITKKIRKSFTLKRRVKLLFPVSSKSSNFFLLRLATAFPGVFC